MISAGFRSTSLSNRDKVNESYIQYITTLLINKEKATYRFAVSSALNPQWLSKMRFHAILFVMGLFFPLKVKFEYNTVLIYKCIP